jgi:hypothetical protein
MLMAVLLTPMLAAACSPPAAQGAARALSQVRHEQLPEHLPEAWRKLLEQESARLPKLALSDPEAVTQVRNCLFRVPWIDPSSIEVAPDLPAGIRATYRPRTPRLALGRGDQAVALLADDGVLLPDGFSPDAMSHYLRVPMASGQQLPESGERVSDPLQQEALAAVREAILVRDTLGVKLARIERRYDFPADTVGVPPALSFLCADGREICWGWSAVSEARIAPPAEARIPLAVKVQRLQAVLAVHPGLEGVSRVIVDRALVRLYDLEGKELPLPAGI